MRLYLILALLICSDVYVPPIIPRPVPPIASTLLHSRSPQHMMSPRPYGSPITSPVTVSGASTPLNDGGGAVLFRHQKQPSTDLHEMGMTSRSQKNFYPNNSGMSYEEPKPEILRGAPLQSLLFRETVQSGNGLLRHHESTRPFQGDVRVLCNGQTLQANRVSQRHPLKDPVKLTPLLDLRPSCPMLSRNNGV